MLIIVAGFKQDFDLEYERKERLALNSDDPIINLVNIQIRTEDIKSIFEDYNNKTHSIIEFYDQPALLVKEEFLILAKRVEDLEIEYYYDTSRDFGDEEFRKDLLEEEDNDI